MFRNRKKEKIVKIRLDLTKRNLDVLNALRDLVQDREGIDFAFADVNCNLAVKIVITHGSFSIRSFSIHDDNYNDNDRKLVHQCARVQKRIPLLLSF